MLPNFPYNQEDLPANPMPTLSSLSLPPPRNWQDFEDLCCDLWRLLWNDPWAQKHGRSGQPQAGVDIFGRPDCGNAYEGVQCKLRGESSFLSRQEIEKEVEKARTFKPPLRQFLIATTAPSDVAVQEAAREITLAQLHRGSFPVSIAFWDEILLNLASYPDLIAKHYPDLVRLLPSPPAPTPGGVSVVSSLPPYYFPRPEVRAAVKARLLALDTASPGITTPNKAAGDQDIGRVGADSSEATTITSWFETGAAYIDPDDHGSIGFALVPFLLLLYDKVVVHSPYAGQIVAAQKELPREFQPLLLEWGYLRELACDPGREDAPPLRITAFPTYVDAHLDKTRDRDFRAIKGVDDERLDPKSVFYGSIILIEEDPRPINAGLAMDLAEDSSRLELAKRRILDSDLPPRFAKALKDDRFYCPADLRQWWLHAVPEQKLVALAAYDYLNDRTALSKGSGNVHCLTTAGEFAAELILGIDDAPFQVADMDNPAFQSQLVLEIMHGLSNELKFPQVNASFIRDFRSEHRMDFVRDVSSILEELVHERDPVRRKRRAHELARAKARPDSFTVILGRSSLDILLKILSPVTLGLAKTFLPSLPRKRHWRYALRSKLTT